MDSSRCEVRHVDGRFSFCTNEVAALTWTLPAGRPRGTCWPHLAKVLRQLRAEYRASEFGITFVDDRGAAAELDWWEYLGRLIE